MDFKFYRLYRFFVQIYRFYRHRNLKCFADYLDL